MKTKEVKIKIQTILNPGDTITTKELAIELGITTGNAYKFCCEFEKEGWLFKLGYKTKYGTQDPMHSNLKPNSLIWQYCI